MKQLILVFFISIVGLTAFSQGETEQDRLATIESQLQQLSVTQQGLNEPVQISLSEVPIQEFIRGVGAVNNLNVSVSQSLDVLITNNFSDAPVKEVFLYLCKEYQLKIDFTGSIMSFGQYMKPESDRCSGPRNAVGYWLLRKNRLPEH